MSKYYFILLCFASCTINSETTPCRHQGVDYIFFGQFENCILIITQYQLGNEKATTEYFSKAVTCLYAITGIEDNIYRGDSMGYMSREDLIKDIDAWSKWFIDNQKTFSIEDANQKFEEYNKANQENLTWPEIFLNK